MQQPGLKTRRAILCETSMYLYNLISSHYSFCFRCTFTTASYHIIPSVSMHLYSFNSLFLLFQCTFTTASHYSFCFFFLLIFIILEFIGLCIVTFSFSLSRLLFIYHHLYLYIYRPIYLSSKHRNFSICLHINATVPISFIARR
jgi:hypothetical protein